MTMPDMPTRPRLLIIYNADSGVISALRDALWKLVSPATYPCSLCAITYGAVSMYPEWKRYLKGLPVEVVFHHKDDFAAAFPGQDIALPAIAIVEGDAAPIVLVSNQVLDQTQDTMQLMDRVEEALARYGKLRPQLRAVS